MIQRHFGCCPFPGAALETGRSQSSGTSTSPRRGRRLQKNSSLDVLREILEPNHVGDAGGQALFVQSSCKSTELAHISGTVQRRQQDLWQRINKGLAAQSIVALATWVWRNERRSNPTKICSCTLSDEQMFGSSAGGKARTLHDADWHAVLCLTGGLAGHAIR